MLSAADLAIAQTNLVAQKANYTFTTKSLPATVTLEGREDALAQYQLAQSILDKVTDLARDAAQPAGTIGGKARSPAPAPAAPAPATAPSPAPAPVVAAPVAAPAAAPRAAATSVPAVGSTTHVVTVNINGGTPTTFATASANDSNTVVGFLQTLESAARSAGALT